MCKWCAVAGVEALQVRKSHLSVDDTLLPISIYTAHSLTYSSHLLAWPSPVASRTIFLCVYAHNAHVILSYRPKCQEIDRNHEVEEEYAMPVRNKRFAMTTTLLRSARIAGIYERQTIPTSYFVFFFSFLPCRISILLPASVCNVSNNTLTRSCSGVRASMRQYIYILHILHIYTYVINPFYKWYTDIHIHAGMQYTGFPSSCLAILSSPPLPAAGCRPECHSAHVFAIYLRAIIRSVLKW